MSCSKESKPRHSTNYSTNNLRIQKAYHLVDDTKEESNEEIKDDKSEYSIQTGISQQSGISAITVATQDLGLNSETTCLLLDPDEYVLSHIKEALNFPAPEISRDKFTSDLYRYVYA